MALYAVGQAVQITQTFNDRSFTVNAMEQGRVKLVEQTGNVQIDFGANRIVTFLPHELQTWLRPAGIAAAQPSYVQQARPAYAPPVYGQQARPAYAPPVYGQPAQPAYGPPANVNAYGAQSQPNYAQQPAYAKPAYVAPPASSAYEAQKPVYQGPAQPMYPSLKPQPVYQPPRPQENTDQRPMYAPPPLNENAAVQEIANNAVEEYKNELESKKRELSLPMTGTLNVRVGGCKKLPGVDTFGGCDPYVVITYGKNSEKTSKKNSKNPEFNESFMFPIESEQYLLVEVWDYNAVGSDEKMFTLPIPFHGMIQYGFKQRHEFALSEKGRISLDLTYTPSENSEFKEREDVVVQFYRKPFGLELVGGPNNIGAKLVGFSKNVASDAGAKLGMYVTQINGISVIGTRYKVVMKLLKNAGKQSTLNFADLRVGNYGDEVSI